MKQKIAIGLIFALRFTLMRDFPTVSGLGTGTIAEDWIKDAVAFWEEQM